MPKQTSSNLRDLDEGMIKSVYLGLREGELKAIDSLANRLGVPRNEVVRYAIRQLVREYDGGKAEIQTERKHSRVKLRMP